MDKDNLTIHLSSGLALELVFIQGGLFEMGSDAPEAREREACA